MTVQGKYDIVAEINKGSYGQVSLARDKESGYLYALKCIAKSSFGDNSDQDKLYQEALHEINIHRALGSHPNIVELIDHFEQDGRQYLVLEYCANGDLYEAIKAGRGPREQGNILEFMLQLIDVVSYCHSKGVYHRDIKPENILISNDGRVKLADWGLATTTKICQDFGAGSERYMAPELFDETNTPEYDAEKADVWSVGICLLNILFGRNPFNVASQKDKLFLDFALSREALFDIFPSLSGDVFAVLRHCLTMDPDNRSLKSMRAELLKVQMWTSDDEFYDDEVEDELATATAGDQDEDGYDHCFASRNVSNVVTPKASPSTIVATTEKREPFRTPSHFHFTGSPIVASDWVRTMQFTPPKSHGFKASSIKPPSSLSVMFSADTVHNSEEDDEEEHQSIPEEFESDGVIDDVFAMDGDLSDTFQRKMSIGQRNVSNSDSSISSVPSLIHSLPKSNHGSSSLSAPKPNRDFLKLGKSWSDIDFDEDDKDEFYELIQSSFPQAGKRPQDMKHVGAIGSSPLVIPWSNNT